MENLLLWQGTRILCTSQISLQMKTKRTHIQDGKAKEKLIIMCSELFLFIRLMGD